MRLLAIDTATEACSAALWLDGRVLEHYEVVGRGHTERLLPMVHAMMSEAGTSYSQLDGIACGVGPGSFAGVRIAVGFAKGVAMSLELPVVPVSSLAMLAQARIEAGAERVIACIDARMNEVYLGVYERGTDGLAQALQPEQVCPPGEARVPTAPGWAAVGSGWLAYESILKESFGVEIPSIDSSALPRAAQALRLALPQFGAGAAASADALAPVYLRDRVALTLLEQAELRRKAP